MYIPSNQINKRNLVLVSIYRQTDGHNKDIMYLICLEP